MPVLKIKEKLLVYVFQLIPEDNTPYTTRSIQKVKYLFSNQKQTFLKNLSFLSYNGVDCD